MSIGDINSTERGSGARFNDGKPAMELIDFEFLAGIYEDRPPQNFFHALALFQRTGLDTHLLCAFGDLCDAFNISDEEALRAAARVFYYGRKKYAAWNWAKGMPWSVPLACIARHALSIVEGEGIDPESGEPHYGHIVCNLVMLYTFTRTYPEGNDLPIEVLGSKPVTKKLPPSDGYFYVATPYTSHPLGQHEAYKAANEAAARLHTEHELLVFSPIGHSHSLCEVYGTTDGIKDHLDAQFWKRFDKPLLDAAYGLAVVMMPGWSKSYGINHEVNEARRQGKPIHFYNWPDLEDITERVKDWSDLGYTEFQFLPREEAA